MYYLSKRILGITVAVALQVSTMPLNNPLLMNTESPLTLTASAAETSGKCGENVNWGFDASTNTLTISGSGPMYDFEPYIIDPILPVPWSGYSKSIRKIVISSGVTTIGDKAFRDCEALTEISIPEGVTRIGRLSFSFCYALTAIRLPGTLKEIDSGAFNYCRNLTAIVIPDGVSSFGADVFNECTSLKSIKLPQSLQYITASCFLNCPVTEIAIPSNVLSIGETAFSGCQPGDAQRGHDF